MSKSHSDDFDVLETCKPKSDQLNADDLIGGAITVSILSVRRLKDEQQPVAIEIGGDRQPYKPCKSMRRLMAELWGRKSKQWVGRKMTLFRDADVTYGGQSVGGIRISHMSGIDKTTTVMLTTRRGMRTEYTVEPVAGFDVRQQLAGLKEYVNTLGTSHGADWDVFAQWCGAVLDRDIDVDGLAFVNETEFKQLSMAAKQFEPEQ